ncbi:OV-16 antigen [Termitomyces sp. J132]|nr:hypothetical protein H2248_006563 [Termitomyces sp. 'cryptogamus']KNZ77151.1 OV-16 antigen [Termitomyces sp. J132]
MRSFFVLVLSFLPVLHAQINSTLLANVTQAFSQAQIVPDVISSFAPTDLVNITFPAIASAPTASVTPGSLLPMNQTATQPTFTLITDDTTTSMNNETFVIALVDPDVPSPSGTGRTEFFHFLGANFSMDPSSSNLVNSTPAVLEWFPPTPPPGDPPHRYTLVVYEQPDSFSDVVPTLVNASTNRLSFNFSSFTVAANLASPIAGNYFLVGADNSTAASATPSATPTATNQPTLTALPLSTSGISSILTISTSTVIAPPTTSPISAAGYPKPMMGGISFVILALVCELF